MILCEECIKTFGKGNAQPAHELVITESVLIKSYRAKFLCSCHSARFYEWRNARIDVYASDEDRAYPIE